MHGILAAFTSVLVLAQVPSAAKLPDRAMERFGSVAYSHNDGVRSLAFSDDGRYLLAVDGLLRVWDTTRGIEMAHMTEGENSPRDVVAARFQGEKLLGADRHGYFLWDTEKRELTTRVGRYTDPHICSFSGDGKWFCYAAHEDIVFHDVVKRKQVGESFGVDTIVSGVALSADGKLLAVGDESGQVTLWDPHARRRIKSFSYRKTPDKFRPVEDLKFSHDGKTLYYASDEGKVIFLEVPTLRQLRSIDAQDVRDVCLALTCSDKVLATGGSKGIVRLWNTETGERLADLNGGQDSVACLAFSSDGQRLAVGDAFGSVNLWDLTAKKLLTPRSGHRGTIRRVAFLPDGRRLISAGEDGKLLSWRPGNEAPTRLELHKSATRELWLARAGSALVTLDGTGRLNTWTLPEFKHRRSISVEKPVTVLCLAVSADGKRAAVATIGRDERKPDLIRIYDLESGKQVKEFTATDSRQTHAMCFVPDGKTLLMRGHSFFHSLQVQLWNLDRSESWMQGSLKGYKGDSHPVLDVSCDAKKCVTDELNGRCSIWDLATARKIRDVKGSAQIVAAAISPDSRLLATGSKDGVLDLWNLASGDLLLTRSGHRGAIMTLVFSDDSEKLVSGSRDSTMIVWNTKGLGM